MKALILLLPLLLCIGIGFVIGNAIGSHRSRWHKEERTQMLTQVMTYHALRSSLYRQAAEHLALGEPFAAIVMDEIDKTEREGS